MPGTDRIDIADIDEIAPPFDLDGGAAPAPTPTPTIVAESEFDIAAVAARDIMLTTFGDTVTYKPTGGGEREILAIIRKRTVPEGLDGMPRGKSHIIEMDVANDATDGIASYEIRDRQDSLNIALRLGNTAEDRLIMRLLAHDTVWCTIEVR